MELLLAANFIVQFVRAKAPQTVFIYLHDEEETTIAWPFFSSTHCGGASTVNQSYTQRKGLLRKDRTNRARRINRVASLWSVDGT